MFLTCSLCPGQSRGARPAAGPDPAQHGHVREAPPQDEGHWWGMKPLALTEGEKRAVGAILFITTHFLFQRQTLIEHYEYHSFI